MALGRYFTLDRRCFSIDVSLVFTPDVSLIFTPDVSLVFTQTQGQEASVSIQAPLMKVWVTLGKFRFHFGYLPISPGVRPFCEHVLSLEQDLLAVLSLQTVLHSGFEQGL